MSYSKRQLWGGAITTQLPTNLIDASQFREIPDSQEVYVSKTTEDSIIFDLLEYATDPIDSKALEYHIAELTRVNGDDESSYKLMEGKIEEFENCNIQDSKSYVAVTLQNAKKWGRDQTLLVSLFGLIRIGKVDTDLLISVYLPFKEVAELQELQKVMDGDRDEDNLAIKKINNAKKDLISILSSTKVENWELFG
ncbi:hypothetical protein CANARDRAFT_5220 [[Candida] arabinofermentans NRRL YB-2248]|uniref:Mog1p/PsbP-like protein n=1 Tax=[Candida] arabinofermentans NRRL YB-2248 TaxID=983967 RepID=A0A1E4T830_9ASCO|nr:hypothetical protein CANARDRAFT_5220 [[Candida] arabinofermentans NRRL YB-2248]